MHQPRPSPRCRPRAIRVGFLCLCWLLVEVGSAFAGPPVTPAAARAFDADAPHRVLISRHCLGCHNNRLKTAGLELDALVEQHTGLDRATWEKVARKPRAATSSRSVWPVTATSTSRVCASRTTWSC